MSAAPVTPRDGVPLIDVVGVTANRPRGHIALGEPGGPALVSFVSLGPVLCLGGVHDAVELTAAAARNLVGELVRWADRQEGK